MNTIKVGSLVRDLYSGFLGMSIARVTYMNGCVQHEVQAHADKNNKMQPNLWIDEQQLEDLEPEVDDVLKPRKKRKYVIKDQKIYNASRHRRRFGGGHRGHP